MNIDTPCAFSTHFATLFGGNSTTPQRQNKQGVLDVVNGCPSISGGHNYVHGWCALKRILHCRSGQWAKQALPQKSKTETGRSPQILFQSAFVRPSHLCLARSTCPSRSLILEQLHHVPAQPALLQYKIYCAYSTDKNQCQIDSSLKTEPSSLPNKNTSTNAAGQPLCARTTTPRAPRAQVRHRLRSRPRGERGRRCRRRPTAESQASRSDT